jgi:hypothetical protein
MGGAIHVVFHSPTRVGDHSSLKLKLPFVRRGLTQAAFITLSCSCYVWKWCREKFDFAKGTQHESAMEIIPEDENVGSRLEPSLSTSRKVILPNKANSSAS